MNDLKSAERSLSSLEQLDADRRRIGGGLTLAMMLVYFGFILLVAYAKPLLTTMVVPGLSIGIVMGTLVILAAWMLMWVYVRWANRHYDRAVALIRTPHE